MEDFEKNRAEYVTHLEQQVVHLQQQLANLKAQEQWIPKVGTHMDTARDEARLTLAFNGKHQTVVLPCTMLRTYNTADLTANILAAMQDLVLDQLRPVVETDVGKLQHGAKSIEKAGKW